MKANRTQLLVLLVLFWAGCSGCAGCAGCSGPDPIEHVATIADSTVHRLQADGQNSATSGLLDIDGELEQVEVYVDRTLSMQPYVLNERTAFDQVLTTFDTFIASKVNFYGFGFERRDDEVQTVEGTTAQQLKRRQAYTMVNNDYAALIEQFEPDDATYVIVTDGVQSDPTEGARLALVADRLHRWVSAGGALAVLIYRTPYRGQYYSDLAGPDPRYNCDDRPLVLFVLAPSAGAIDALLERIDPDLTLDHMVRAGGRDAEVVPADYTIPQDQQRRDIRVLRDTEQFVVQGYEPVFWVQVDPSAARRVEGMSGFMPFQVQVGIDLREEPWSTLGLRGSQRFLEEADIELSAWRLHPRALAPRDTSAEARALLEPIQPHRRETHFERIGQRGDSLLARYTVPLRKPEGDARHRDYVFVVHVEPSERNVRDLIPASFSTDNDLPSSACDKTLRLQQLVGTIMLRNYTPGQALVLADWR